MRVVKMLAAIAALWAMPAQAVTIVLQQPTPESGKHQKISLTGLTAEDNIYAGGAIAGVTYYYWQSPGLLHADQAPPIICSIESGDPACGGSYTFVSPTYPVKSITSFNVNIVENDIYVDWTLFAQDVCASVPETEQTASFMDVCGFSWVGDDVALLSFDVVGPSSQTYGYTITDIAPNPVPEPVTWALMTIGIALAGAAMRRRPAIEYVQRTIHGHAA